MRRMQFIGYNRVERRGSIEAWGGRWDDGNHYVTTASKDAAPLKHLPCEQLPFYFCYNRVERRGSIEATGHGPGPGLVSVTTASKDAAPLKLILPRQ